MTGQHFAIFDTAIGSCGIVWGERGITGVQLPMGNEEKTRKRIHQRNRDVTEATNLPVIGKHLVSTRQQMRGFSATGKVLTLTKQTEIDQCERVRVNWKTAASKTNDAMKDTSSNGIVSQEWR